MTNNDDGTFTSGSAANLGAACEPESPGSRITSCARNISDLFEGLFNRSEAGLPPVIVSFQEATRWKDLQSISESSLKTMASNHHKSGNAHLVTFFHKSAYTPEVEIKGEFSKGRPWQLLIFREGLIYVNLHLGHHKSAAYVAKKLSAGLLKAIPVEEERQKLSSYRIIMAGDFNDHSHPGVLTQLVPFADAGIQTQVSAGDTFNTCCDTDTTTRPWEGTKSGDYVLDSASPASLSVPFGYDYTKLYSDHLPVVGRLKPMASWNFPASFDQEKVKEFGVYLVPVLSTRLKLWGGNPKVS